MTNILDRVLAEARSASAPVRLRDLATRLGIEESALGGILDLLAHKGDLVVSNDSVIQEGLTCWSNACGATCVGLSACPFVAETPTSYSVSRAIER